MCVLCKRFRCPSNCPNADRPKPVFVCAKCGYGLRYGDDAYRIDEDTVWCENCMLEAAFEVTD